MTASAKHRTRATRAAATRLPVLLLGLAAVLLAGLILSVAFASATAPTVTVSDASAVAYTTATAEGTVDPADHETTYRFQYATEPDFSNASSAGEATLAEGAGVTPVEAQLTGLAPGATYHLRLVAENTEGEVVEALAANTFTTEPVATPTVSLEPVTTFTATTATFTGHINPNAPAGPLSPAAQAAFKTSWHFQCNPACPGLSGELAADNSSHDVSAHATGLSPGTLYEVSLIAENAGGSIVVGLESFTTLTTAPTILSTSALEVGDTTAKLSAEIDPGAAATTYHFEYGPTAAYGSTTPESESIGEDNATHTVSALIGGLAPATGYHYRVVATNSQSPVGGTFGPDRVITAQAASPSTLLPDNRAYEMVSPLDKNSGPVLGLRAVSGGGVIQASPAGDAVTYVTFGSFADPVGAAPGNQYVATRNNAGWMTQNITPPTVAHAYGTSDAGAPYKAFSEDLSQGILINADVLPSENFPLDPAAPPGYQNYYLRDLSNNSYTALMTTQPDKSAASFRTELVGATSDLAHMVLATNGALTEGQIDATGSARNLTDWTAGQLEAINILPGGAPAPSAFLGAAKTPYESNTISDDGSKIFWTNRPEADSALYMYRRGGSTVEIDASKGPGPSGEGVFLFASRDGARVFFTDYFRLTPDSTADSEAHVEDLYEFDTNTGTLTDRSVDNTPGDERGADVQGIVGASEDGSTVYFVAKGAISGVTPNVAGEAPTSGQDNLYIYRDGRTTFVATLFSSDENDWALSLGARTSRVTADGGHLLFMSSAGLTGYDNTDANTGTPDNEIYLFDAQSGHVSCVSCKPSGARPTGASRIPAGTNFEETAYAGNSLYESRVLSADGSRVFFDSSDALSPGDSNNTQDVYEYEHGTVSLISGGTNAAGSSFVDASESGDDVFFITEQQLVPSDTDALVDLYDARVGGSYAAQPRPNPCEGEGCRGPASSPPNVGPPASTTLLNVRRTPAHQHKVRRKKTGKKPTKRHKRGGKDHKSSRAPTASKGRL